MDKKEQFYDIIKKEMGVILATSSKDSVTMRMVSPVYCDGGILIFTAPTSQKYRQLEENPYCCFNSGLFFAEAKAEFLGSTMLDKNEAYRAAYSAKFPGAFDEGVPMGGREADFVLFRPFKLTGWMFENDVPTPEGVPTIPFEIALP